MLVQKRTGSLFVSKSYFVEFSQLGSSLKHVSVINDTHLGLQSQIKCWIRLREISLWLEATLLAQGEAQYKAEMPAKKLPQSETSSTKGIRENYPLTKCDGKKTCTKQTNKEKEL